MGIATFGWTTVVLFGALPFIFSGTIRDVTAAIFESVSGFTTTGASVLSDLESIPKGILLWRATTHFLGGMGILVLCVAILPLIGVGGMQLYRAEVAGPSKDRLTPRIASTAKLLWGVYMLLNLLATLMLRLGGMTWFDAICHSFAAVATGGFSTRSASIAAYNSSYIEVVMIVFMFLGATNFALHYAALRGDVRRFFKDPELRLFLGIITVACAIVTLNIWHRVYPSFWSALRNGVFATASLFTTTGFGTGDFGEWPATSKVVLLLGMVLGGCVGSTAGAIKQMRIMVALKRILLRVKIFIYPQASIRVKAGGQPVDDDIVTNILTYVVLYLVAMVIATILMTLFLPDILSAMSSVIATMGGVGPGFGLVGPTKNYACIPSAGKIILMLCMLLGRLEFFSIMALFYPSFWKR